MPPAFQATPILLDDVLYYCTPFNRVFALEPTTGEEIWSYDPGLDHAANSALPNCRGVSAWQAPEGGEPPLDSCRERIFTATMDARLIALDARTGEPCAGFGEPVYPVEERAVPQRPVPGEYLSPTQPFPTHFPHLVQPVTADDAWGLMVWDEARCHRPGAPWMRSIWWQDACYGACPSAPAVTWRRSRSGGSRAFRPSAR